MTTASVGDGARFAARPVSGGGTPTPRPRRHHRRPDCRRRARGGGVGERRWCGVRRIIRGGGGCAAGTDRRLRAAGRRDPVNLVQRSLDQPWPTGGFDPIVLSEVGYYLRADTLRAVLDRERPRLADGASIVAAHWRHPVDDIRSPATTLTRLLAPQRVYTSPTATVIPTSQSTYSTTASAISVAAADG